MIVVRSDIVYPVIIEKTDALKPFRKRILGRFVTMAVSLLLTVNAEYCLKCIRTAAGGGFGVIGVNHFEQLRPRQQVVHLGYKISLRVWQRLLENSL